MPPRLRHDGVERLRRNSSPYGSLDGVEAIVLEATGTFAILRRGAELDRAMLERVR